MTAIPRGRCALLVASSGGHLKELHHLRGRLAGVAPGEVRWATFDSPQTRSLLAGEEVDFVPFVGPRDAVNAARNIAHARRIIDATRPDLIVSTGSAVAVPFLAVGRSRGLDCHYVESAARIDGPSLSGRLVSLVPGVRLHTQCRSWAGRRWRFGGSVFDSFASVAAESSAKPAIEKVVVSLGTPHGYDFSRLVRRLVQVLPTRSKVLWQTGDTDVTGLGIEVREAVPEAKLSAAMREADLVVAHAGVGTALAALEVGKCPLLVPRRLAQREHVDDHQVQIAGELAGRGLAVTAEAENVDLGDLLVAAGRRVERPAQTPAFDMLD